MVIFAWQQRGLARLGKVLGQWTDSAKRMDAFFCPPRPLVSPFWVSRRPRWPAQRLYSVHYDTSTVVFKGLFLVLCTLSLPNPGLPHGSSLLPPTFQRKVSASIDGAWRGRLGSIRGVDWLHDTSGPACGPGLGKGTGRSARRSGWLGGWRRFWSCHGGRARRFIHATGLIGWASVDWDQAVRPAWLTALLPVVAAGLGPSMIAPQTPGGRSTGGGHTQKTREIGEHRQSLVFPSGPGPSTPTAFFFPLLYFVLVSDHVSVRVRVRLRLHLRLRLCLRLRCVYVYGPRGPKPAHCNKLSPLVLYRRLGAFSSIHPPVPRSAKGSLGLISLPSQEPFSFILPPSQVNRCSRNSCPFPDTSPKSPLEILVKRAVS